MLIHKTPMRGKGAGKKARAPGGGGRGVTLRCSSNLIGRTSAILNGSLSRAWCRQTGEDGAKTCSRRRENQSWGLNRS